MCGSDMALSRCHIRQDLGGDVQRRLIWYKWRRLILPGRLKMGATGIQHLSDAMKFKNFFKLLSAALLLADLMVPRLSLAASDEIQVYGNDLNESGELTQEIHMNYVTSAVPGKAWPQQLPDRHMLRLTSETSYGLGHNIDAGLYLPFIKGNGDEIRLDGAKVRLRYMERVEGDGFYWGINTEIGRVSLLTVESHWNAELRPIIGWHHGLWEISANPSIGWALSEHRGAPEFSPAIKVAYSVRPDLAVGFEQYYELGPINKLLANSQNSQTTFLAIDGKIAHNDFNFGIGHGYGVAGDKWVVKGIVGLAF